MDNKQELNLKNANYYMLFEEQVKQASKCSVKPKLLMHACCCPCSSHCIELLSEIFDITIYFYNPNIDELEEYEKRYAELIKLKDEAEFAKNIHLIYGDYEPEKFYEMARGRERLPERSERCYDCYMMRLKKSADYAMKNGFDYFTTTLSISPYKNADWINEIGIKLEKEISENGRISDHPKFLFSDFKKKNGYKRSIELSKEYGLYRQDYCGCVFSKAERDRKKSEQ